MNYKAADSSLEWDGIKSTHNLIGNDIGEIDPQIFPFLENVFTDGDLKDIAEKLHELVILSPIIALHPFMADISNTMVPQQLIKLVVHPNRDISDSAIEVIYNLISSKSKEYGKLFFENYFVLQCYEILKLQTTKCYWVFKSLTKIVQIHKTIKLLIPIPIDLLAYLVQSDTLDEGSHQELLTFLLVLTKHSSELDPEDFEQLFEIFFCLLPFFLNDRSKHDTKCILRMMYLFSPNEKCAESLLIIQVIDKLCHIVQNNYDLICRKLNTQQSSISDKLDKVFKYAIGTLANYLSYIDFDIENIYFVIYNILKTNLPLAASKCILFIRRAIEKYEISDSRFYQELLELLLEVKTSYSFKLQITIFEITLNILHFIDDGVLLQFILEYSLMLIFVEIIEMNQKALIKMALDAFLAIVDRFQYDERVMLSFIESDGIESLSQYVNYLNSTSSEDSELFTICNQIITDFAEFVV